MLKFIIIIIIIIRTLIALIRSGKQNVISDGLPLLFVIFCFYLSLFFFFFWLFAFSPVLAISRSTARVKIKYTKEVRFCEALWENSWGFLKKKTTGRGGRQGKKKRERTKRYNQLCPLLVERENAEKRIGIWKKNTQKQKQTKMNE